MNISWQYGMPYVLCYVFMLNVNTSKLLLPNQHPINLIKNLSFPFYEFLFFFWPSCISLISGLSSSKQKKVNLNFLPGGNMGYICHLDGRKKFPTDMKGALERWGCSGDSGAPVGGDCVSSSAFPSSSLLIVPQVIAPSPPFSSYGINKTIVQDSALVSTPSQPVFLIQQHRGIVVERLIHALESWAPAHRLRLQPCRPGMQRQAAVTEREVNWPVIYINTTKSYAPVWVCGFWDLR